MDDAARRERVAHTERGTPLPQWEVFVREIRTDPLQHVGSVAAESATEAHDHATRLFGPEAVDLWCCPAAAVERFSSRPLSAATDERCEVHGFRDVDENDDGEHHDADEHERVTDA